MSTNVLYRPVDQAAPPLPSGLYTVGQAARLVGFSRDALHRCVVDGRLPSHRYSGIRVIAASDLREFQIKHVARAAS
jgi:excisionase family DNA binding protein